MERGHKHLIVILSAAKNLRRFFAALRMTIGVINMKHAPGFLNIVQDAKSRVKECTVSDVKGRLDRGEKLNIIDVREESEYAADHVPGSVHLGKGVIERDIESKFPDRAAELILYCGGGFRSALAADNIQKMGYTNVISMDGGARDWRNKGYPMEK